jgi:hypothetical protein
MKNLPMKLKITKILVIAAAVLSISSANGQSYAHAGEYMGFISEQHVAISKDQWQYTSAVANDRNAKKIETKRKDLLAANQSAQRKIERMKDWNGDTAYRDSVVSFLKLNYAVLNEDYEKIMNMEEIAEQSYDLMEAYLLAQKIAGEKVQAASDMLNEVQTRFAADNNITLLDDQSKRSKKLENAGLVYDHYNEVYLIFFKCYKQEMYLLDAMNTVDLSGMEQNNSSLLIYAEEGLDKLKKCKPYLGDHSLVQCGNSMLRFYKEEAEKKMPVLIDFYLKKEAFQTIDASFQAKKQKDRSAEDVEQFNTAVNDYNAAIENYNKVNDELNKERSKQLDNWNNLSKKYTRKHIK